ncbi:MAG: hypothetical protein DRN78_05220 [Thermoproteota archaeon]|nr:MAG: hypothetical protein DRN78_05220 [Candidatus Korarchaeota archaeon]
MTDQKGQEQQGQEQKGQGQEEQQKVELDVETYTALLDRLEELEQAVEKGTPKGKGKSSVDDLLDELDDPDEPSGQKDEPVDLDSMSRAEFLQFTLQQISEGVISPLAVAVEEMRLDREIDKLTRDEKYQDFWDYKDEIYQIAKDNPKLSLKKAYLIAKQEASEKAKGKGKDETGGLAARAVKLKTRLPDPRAFGERPSGTPTGSTQDMGPVSLEEAAARAYDEAMKGGKE